VATKLRQVVAVEQHPFDEKIPVFEWEWGCLSDWLKRTGKTDKNITTMYNAFCHGEILTFANSDWKPVFDD